jgi:hypothetical protein
MHASDDYGCWNTIICEFVPKPRLPIRSRGGDGRRSIVAAGPAFKMHLDVFVFLLLELQDVY